MTSAQRKRSSSSWPRQSHDVHTSSSNMSDWNCSNENKSRALTTTVQEKEKLDHSSFGSKFNYETLSSSFCCACMSMIEILSNRWHDHQTIDWFLPNPLSTRFVLSFIWTPQTTGNMHNRSWRTARLHTASNRSVVDVFLIDKSPLSVFSISSYSSTCRCVSSSPVHLDTRTMFKRGKRRTSQTKFIGIKLNFHIRSNNIRNAYSRLSTALHVQSTIVCVCVCEIQEKTRMNNK